MNQTLFDQGKTIQEFLDSFGENRARFDELLADSELNSEQRQAIAGLPAELRVVVIAEPWSGDVLYNLPPLIKMAQAAGWELRIFNRDKHPDLILNYLKDGLYRSIPVFVFYDPEFHELGHWVERPQAATRLIEEESLKLRRRLRAEHAAEWRQETINELLALAGGQV